LSVERQCTTPNKRTIARIHALLAAKIKKLNDVIISWTPFYANAATHLANGSAAADR